MILSSQYQTECEKLIDHLEKLLIIAEYQTPLGPEFTTLRSYIYNGLDNISTFRISMNSGINYNPVYLPVPSDGYEQSTSPYVTSSYEQFKAAINDKHIEEPYNKSSSERYTTTSNDYASMKISQLKDILREKGLKVSGNKAELIQRLIDAGY